MKLRADGDFKFPRVIKQLTMNGGTNEGQSKETQTIEAGSS